MAKTPKPDPVKFCLWCKKLLKRKRFNGRLEDRGAFLRRKFCSLSCGTSFQHSKEPPTVAASRKRAHKIASSNCEICGTNSDPNVHHTDGNPKNNDLKNLQSLCASCHSFWHAAARRVGIANPGRMPPIFR